MLVSAVTLGCALLLGQVEGGPPAEVTPVEVAPAEVAPPIIQPPAVPLPFQDSERPALCLELPPTPNVPSGQWRAQCSHEQRRCLITPRRELDVDGQETERFLERVRPCVPEEAAPVPNEELRTYRLEPSIADAPPGWYRDERGRVMQFNFDLHRRVWLGGAWSPLWPGDEAREDRVRLDFGIALELAARKRLHRLHFLETELSLGEPSIDFSLLRYDFSVERDEPLFRITTFFGEPRRYDVSINLGVWLETLRVEDLERGQARGGFLTWGTLHATLDLWHSRDLVSYVRVRAGPSAERDYENGISTLVPGAALEGNLTLDRDGFHHLRFGVEAEKVLLSRAVEGRPLRPERLRLSAGYELILLAINDQPLSLVADARGVWRNDIAFLPERWEWSASAGLRFSLWAPARRSAPIAEKARD
ncbi:hypothetical protein HUA78_03650 [Myxococcus sp. CA033]|uniref:hypothetical protein n=1 Tax=Myxococcus sp. CA033 TaxID=2741516 RepID=UPI00157B667B|nr:hypothetical protein [Myxococcus sp. CA033]NTX33523.1 hypothetical protein [Myxococcus sp. CA033]